MAVQSPKDIQLYTGSMDSDTELRYIRQGDYVKLLNGRSSITNGQNYGAVEDAEGNYLVLNKYYFEFQNQQPGYSKVIGSYEDLTYNSIIYFVYNSSGNHGIYRYFPKKDDGTINVIEKIYAVENPSIYDKFNKSPLNFQEDHLITGVNLVENLLFFNDGYNQPKQIDIERCNEENKKRIYALYVNNNELINRKQNNQLGAFNFNLSVTDQSLTSTLYTFTYIFGSFDLADVITDLCNQINNLTNAPFYAENKLNYIEIVFKNTGKYFLSVSNDGQFQSRALPLNFYYNDLPEHFFNRIQFPPFCRPNAQFIPVEEPDDNPLQINLNQLIIDWTWNEFPVNSGFYNGERFALLGFPSELNDAYNQSTLGASYINSGLVYSSSTINTSYLNGQLIYNNANAYFIPRPQGESITIDLSYQCNQNDFTVNTGYFYPPTEDITARFKIDLIGVNSSGNIGFTKNILTKTGNTSISSASLIVPVNIPSGLQNYRFLLRVIGNNGTCGILTGGFIAFDGITYADISNLPKSTNNIYRSKYVFENYQSSVYGQATTTILRTKGYYFQDQVEINYRDKFLSDDNFASRIKNVILSYSDDNGTNWYDYETLEPYQFACEGSTSIYDNTKLGIPVDEATAILQYHSVPLSARSQEYADDRIWEGGIVEGYDKIDVDFKVEYVYEQLYQTDIPIYQGTPISLQGFKIGHTGYIGIVYYDDFDRKSPVCIGPNSKIQFSSYDDLYPTGQNFTDYEYIPSLKISIYNDPPEWATKYRIVRTKDFSNTNYLFWRINSYATIDENGVVTPINPVYYKISLDNLTYYVNTGAIGSKINYVFQDGDRIRILSDALGNKLSQTYDLQIEGSDANYIYLKYDPSIPIGDGSLIEIYSKSQNVGIENSLYYEMGECFEIKVGDFNGVKKKYHTGSISVNNSDQIYLATNAVSPAIIQTYNGGCYYRYRKLYRFYNVSGYTLDNIQAWIPSNYADEYTVSGYDGLTRPNTVNIIGQLERPTAFRFTNQYNLTKINGLNENEPLNEQQLSTQYGWLEKIILVNNDVLRLIFRNSYQMSIYVSQGVIRQAQGDVSLISVTDQVAGNSHIIQKTLGTQNPESVYVNDDGDVFGYDEQEGVVWRSSGNGLIQISDYKQKNNFKNWSVERSERNLLKSKTPSVYDIYHDEYILTANDLPAVTSTPNCVTFDLIGPPKTITYDLTLIVEETGEVFISQTGLPGNIEPNQYIKSVFDNLPIWTTKLNNDGTVTVCTLSSNYRDKTFSIQYKVNGVITGPELLRNGDFLEDNAINNTWTNSGWILVSVPDPNFLIGATCLQVFAGNYLLSQQNVGFIPGETIVITLDCVVNSGTFEVRLGNTPGIQYAQTINTTGIYSFQLEYPQDSTDIIRIETYFQDPPDIYIKSISAKRPILQNDTYFKYPVVNGIIGPEEEIVDWEGRTIAFNKQKNGWTHYYSFVPEYYGRLRDQIVSFKNGDLWVHSQLAFPKNYYGVQYGRELTIVVNKDFPKVKQFKALSINGLRKNNVPEIVIPPYEGLSTGMLSELTENHFSVAEGIQYAAIQKDKLTPGYANTNLAWVNGRNMLGQIMTAKIVNNEPFTSVIYNVDILYFYSENS